MSHNEEHTATRILVVGGGFAGLWSAAGARRAAILAGKADDVRVTLVAPNDDLVIRPRMYEQHPEQMRVSLDRVLGPIGAHRVAATVTAVDTEQHNVTAVDRQGRTIVLPYDRLVMAAGSCLVTPELPGAEHLFNVDTMQGAEQLRAHLDALPSRQEVPGVFTAVVVGAGFTGLEIVTELPARLQALSGGKPVRVVLIDRGEQLAEPLGAGPRDVIAQALADHGVEVRSASSAAQVDANGVTLEDGERIDAQTVVWTAGMKASDITAQVPGEFDEWGRLKVDGQLRVLGVPDVFASGDTAAAQAGEDHTTMQACQHAVPLGKTAGYNVAADVLGEPLVTFEPLDYVTCLDLGPGHAVFTEGWDRKVTMTGEEAKNQKHQINGEWIYPPVDDRDEILNQADYRKVWPM